MTELISNSHGNLKKDWCKDYAIIIIIIIVIIIATYWYTWVDMKSSSKVTDGNVIENIRNTKSRHSRSHNINWNYSETKTTSLCGFAGQITRQMKVK